MLVRDENTPKLLVRREKLTIFTDVVAIHKERSGIGDDDAGVGASHVETQKCAHLSFAVTPKVYSDFSTWKRLTGVQRAQGVAQL
jgi:hypothetical protein